MFSTQKIKDARKRAQGALRAARAAHAEAETRLAKHEALRGTMPANDFMTGRMSIKAEAVARIREAVQVVSDGELHALAAELELPATLRRARSLPPLDPDYHDALARDQREVHQILLRRELRDSVADMTPAEVAADIKGMSDAFGANDPPGELLERFRICGERVQRHGSGNEWTDAKAALSIATSKLESVWKGRRELVDDVEYIGKALRAASAYQAAVGEPRDRWPPEALMDQGGLIERQQAA